jgi:hypothetical protein
LDSSDSAGVDVSLTLADVPPSVAAGVQELQREHPELLRRMVVYSVARAAIFETLREHLSGTRA